MSTPKLKSVTGTIAFENREITKDLYACVSVKAYPGAIWYCREVNQIIHRHGDPDNLIELVTLDYKRSKERVRLASRLSGNTLAKCIDHWKANKDRDLADLCNAI